MRKAVIVQTTPKVTSDLRSGKIKLPPNVQFADMRETFDRNCHEARLEGSGLPSNAETTEGALYKRATLVVDQAGTVTEVIII